ncbi:MAG: histidine triad nucleotide-binding protein [Chloroflexi bacterium]|nr:histidine triad nucleotide-binding protein [Chloroflexota bacterium]
MPDCIFCGIVAGTIPSKMVYQDDRITAFWDIDPKMPVHLLMIPNTHVGSVNELEERHEGDIGYLLRAAQAVAKEAGVGESGFRLVINTGPDAQMSVGHLHVHVFGGRPMTWPPG